MTVSHDHDASLQAEISSRVLRELDGIVFVALPQEKSLSRPEQPTQERCPPLSSCRRPNAYAKMVDFERSVSKLQRRFKAGDNCEGEFKDCRITGPKVTNTTETHLLTTEPREFDKNIAIISQFYQA